MLGAPYPKTLQQILRVALLVLRHHLHVRIQGGEGGTEVDVRGTDVDGRGTEVDVRGTEVDVRGTEVDGGYRSQSDEGVHLLEGWTGDGQGSEWWTVKGPGGRSSVGMVDGKGSGWTVKCRSGGR
eukprot:9363913-Pyramimonas_sp.AAC.3